LSGASGGLPTASAVRLGAKRAKPQAVAAVQQLYKQLPTADCPRLDPSPQKQTIGNHRHPAQRHRGGCRRRWR